MPLHYYIFKLIENLFYLFRFIYHYLKCSIHCPGRLEPIRKDGNTIRVFVTGPSLNNEIEELKEKHIELSDSVVVNYFADTELFQVVKPKYYCLVDPGFFGKDNSNLDEKILRYVNIVDWKMQLIVSDYGYKYIKGKVSNDNVTVRWVPTLQFEGTEKLRFYLYRKGKAAPTFINVSIFAIFAMLNAGYEKIELYGADHDYFLKGLCVDDNNEFYLERSHFYGNELQKIVRYTIKGSRWKVSDLMWENYLTFKIHEEMQRYADYLGAKIINCTKNSLIDAYPRLAQIEKNKHKIWQRREK